MTRTRRRQRELTSNYTTLVRVIRSRVCRGHVTVFETAKVLSGGLQKYMHVVVYRTLAFFMRKSTLAIGSFHIPGIYLNINQP